jgi:hypothetical protein
MKQITRTLKIGHPCMSKTQNENRSPMKQTSSYHMQKKKSQPVLEEFPLDNLNLSISSLLHLSVPIEPNSQSDMAKSWTKFQSDKLNK